MRRYELTIITDGNITGDDRSSHLEKITGLIPEHEGLLVAKDEWGIKKLAYPIKKKDRGHYVILDYCGTAALVSEIERQLRIDDRVLKYMTVLLDDHVDLERIIEDIKLKEAEKKAAEEKAGEQKDTLKVSHDESETQTEQRPSETPEPEKIEIDTPQTDSEDKE
jgi:small subunit ribosomal protein S6